MHVNTGKGKRQRPPEALMAGQSHKCRGGERKGFRRTSRRTFGISSQRHRFHKSTSEIAHRREHHRDTPGTVNTETNLRNPYSILTKIKNGWLTAETRPDQSHKPWANQIQSGFNRMVNKLTTPIQPITYIAFKSTRARTWVSPTLAQ